MKEVYEGKVEVERPLSLKKVLYIRAKKEGTHKVKIFCPYCGNYCFVLAYEVEQEFTCRKGFHNIYEKK